MSFITRLTGVLRDLIFIVLWSFLGGLLLLWRLVHWALRTAAGAPEPERFVVLEAQKKAAVHAAYYEWLRHGDNDTKALATTYIDGEAHVFLLRGQMLDEACQRGIEESFERPNRD